ncbi:MAG: phytanoyl-CoA dioxygenase family protein [Gammaproteobacteria bacterium]|nr:phytanoyl-CoA dioxygenase family protein [Gammaproteobacteria bacterium]
MSESSGSSTALSAEAVARFRNDGFLLVEGFFTEQELDGFAPFVDAAVAHRTSGDDRPLSEKNLYEQTFTQCKGLWEDNEEIRPLTFHPRLCAAAASLLDADRVRLWHDQALYKTAGGRKTDAHMDYPFWPVDEPDLVSAWIPFDDVRHGGGVMGYVQGSHRLGLDQFVDIGQLRGGEPVDILQEPEVAALPVVWVEAPRGSVIFHHACTIHLAEANGTATTRRVFTTVYLKDGRCRASDKKSFNCDRDGIRVGQVIDGPGFPVAWPRDTDEWPQPPEVRGPKTGFGFAPEPRP